jgi:hypothetical protein
MNDREHFMAQMMQSLNILMEAIRNLDRPLEEKNKLTALVQSLTEFAFQAGMTEGASLACLNLQKSRFTLSGIIVELEGFTKGETWNGWACPLFTHSQALRLVEAWNVPNEQLENMGRGSARYDAESDCFLFEIEGEVDRFEAEIIEGVKLYPIGAHGWCWEQSHPSEEYPC